MFYLQTPVRSQERPTNLDTMTLSETAQAGAWTELERGVRAVRPVRIFQRGACYGDQVCLASGENVLGLMGVENQAYRLRGHAHRFADACGVRHLKPWSWAAGARGSRTGNSARGAVNQVHAQCSKFMGKPDGVLDSPAAFNRVFDA